MSSGHAVCSVSGLSDNSGELSESDDKPSDSQKGQANKYQTGAKTNQTEVQARALAKIFLV